MQVQMVDAKVYRNGNGNGNRSGLLSSYPIEPAAHVLLYRQIDDVSLLNVRQSINHALVPNPHFLIFFFVSFFVCLLVCLSIPTQANLRIV